MLPVSLQLYQRLCQVLSEPPVRDVPDLDAAVLAGAGYEVVIEGTPPELQDWPRVPGDPASPVSAHPARLGQREDEEAAAATDLLHHSQELRVDSADVGVLGCPAQADVLVTFLSLCRQPEDMAELRGSHTARKQSSNLSRNDPMKFSPKVVTFFRFLAFTSVQHGVLVLCLVLGRCSEARMVESQSLLLLLLLTS